VSAFDEVYGLPFISNREDILRLSILIALEFFVSLTNDSRICCLTRSDSGVCWIMLFPIVPPTVGFDCPNLYSMLTD
jgi:hypothetical protein